MKVVSSWIKTYLRRTILSDQQIVQALDKAGIEIEQVIASKEIDKKIVVALVKKVVQHPAADRLRLVEVSTGQEDLSIVCGAPNVHVGMRTALAQIGAKLPSGDKITKAKLRGEVSEGMLCSERELEIGNDHNGILELSSSVAIGTPLCDIYPMDTVVDIKTPANRFDVQSVTGLAREVAAMTDALFEFPELSPVELSADTKGSVISQDIATGRYILARLAIDSSLDSPRDVSSRLSAAGMRSISSVVDITNFVMLETGQPLHAFDADKISLPLTVRQAFQDETLVTLDGVKRQLSPADLVVADASGPVALAGVMGGQASEVTPQTKEILLEAAMFDGPTVRKTAKRHGLRTEASARIERGLPFELPEIGLCRAIDLFQQHAGGELVEVFERSTTEPANTAIALNLDQLNARLGFSISAKEAEAALENLEIKSQIKVVKSTKTGQSYETITVPRVPWWRPDLKAAEDLVEEIVRVTGYDKVPATLPRWRPRLIEFDQNRAKRQRVQTLLYGAGLFEVMTYSFVSADQLNDLGEPLDHHLKLKNPLSSEQGYLRNSLLGSHLSVLAKNRTYASEIGFYEISKVFLKRPGGQLPEEPEYLTVTLLKSSEAFRSLKGIFDALVRELNVELVVSPAEDRRQTIFAPGRSGEIGLGDQTVGRIGQLHPSRVQDLKLAGEVAQFELDIRALLAAATTRQFAGEQRYPTISRDLSVLLPVAATWNGLRNVLADQDVAYVGEYHGRELPDGYRVVTLRLTLAHADRTPTDSEMAELEQRTRLQLERKLGARPRD